MKTQQTTERESENDKKPPLQSFKDSAKGRKDFCDDIRKQVESGWNFTPLIGSGISADSGIPMGIEFNNYLIYTLYQVLKNTEDVDMLEQRLDLKNEGWPRYFLDKDLPAAELYLAALTVSVAFRDMFNIDQGPSLQNIHKNLERINSFVAQDAVEAVYKFVQREDNYSLRDKLVSIRNSLNSPFSLGEILSDIDSYYLDENGYEAKSDYAKKRLASGKPDSAINNILSFWKHNWITTLDFLCSHSISTAQSVYLGTFKQVILDNFNRTISYKKRHNFGHAMIAHLCEVLGIRTILTTNFDGLIEESLRQINQTFEVFDIGRNEPLPKTNQLGYDLSIIKLHGSRHETRADASLQEPPSVTDSEEFARYFNCSNDCDYLQPPSHLFVFGFSAGDDRIIRLIRKALKENNNTSRPFKVYWVYFSLGDLSRLKKIFPGEINDISSKASNSKGNIVACQSRFPDLFLYEIYQNLTLTTPPGSIGEPFNYRIPPSPLLVGENADKRFESAEKITKFVEEAESVNNLIEIGYKNQYVKRVQSEGKLFTLGGDVEVSSVASIYFQQLVERYKKCVWLDLYDFNSVSQLYAALIDNISTRAGRKHGSTITQDGLQIRQNFSDIVDKHLRITPENWYIFINGRESPSSGSSFREPSPNNTDKSNFKNGNLNEAWFEEILAKRFTIIYLEPENPDNSNRQSHTRDLKESLYKWLNKSSESYKDQILQAIFETHCISEDSSLASRLNEYFGHDKFKENRDDVEIGESDIFGRMAWLKAKFFYHSCLFRNPRHLSALYNDSGFSCFFPFNAFGIDNDKIKTYFVRAWIAELVDHGLFRMLPGGYVWMHVKAKSDLLVDIENRNFRYLVDDPAEPNIPTTKSLKQSKSWMHSEISKWYFDAFKANHTVAPFLEALYHKLQALRFVTKQEEWFDLRQAIRETREHYEGLAESHFDNEKNEFKRDSDEVGLVPLREFWLKRGLQRCIYMLEIGMPLISDKISTDDAKSYFYYWGDQKELSGTIDESNFSKRLEPFFKHLRNQDEESDTLFHESLNVMNFDLRTKELFGRLMDLFIVFEQRNLYLTQNSYFASLRPGAKSFQDIEARIFFEDGAMPSRYPEDTIDSIYSSLDRHLDEHVDIKISSILNDTLERFKKINSTVNNGISLQRSIAAKTRDAIVFVLQSEQNNGQYTFSKAGHAAPNRLTYIRILNRLSLGYIQNGKRLENNGADQSESNAYFVLGCIVSQIVLTIGESVDRSDFLEHGQEMSLAECNYGLSLARLGRFTESKKLLRNAASHLNILAPGGDSEGYAIIDLRFAERALLKFREVTSRNRNREDKFNENNDSRYCLSLLEKSWNYLEKAEEVLRTGKAGSAYWWGRLYYLRAWVLKEAILLSITTGTLQTNHISRIGKSYKILPDVFEETVVHGRLIHPNDTTRINRLSKLIFPIILSARSNWDQTPMARLPNLEILQTSMGFDSRQIIQEFCDRGHNHKFQVNKCKISSLKHVFLLHKHDVATAEKNILIVAGFRDKEPAGTLALLELMREGKFPSEYGFWIAPLMNAADCDNHPASGRNVKEDPEKKRHHEEDLLKSIKSVNLGILKMKFDVILQLQEDSKARGIYIEILDGKASVEEYKKFTKNAEKYIQFDEVTVPSKSGVFKGVSKSNRIDMVGDLRTDYEVAMNCIFKTPESEPLSKRIDAHKSVISSLFTINKEGN